MVFLPIITPSKYHILYPLKVRMYTSLIRSYFARKDPKPALFPSLGPQLDSDSSELPEAPKGQRFKVMFSPSLYKAFQYFFLFPI